MRSFAVAWQIKRPAAASDAVLTVLFLAETASYAAAAAETAAAFGAASKSAAHTTAGRIMTVMVAVMMHGMVMPWIMAVTSHHPPKTHTPEKTAHTASAVMALPVITPSARS